MNRFKPKGTSLGLGMARNTLLNSDYGVSQFERVMPQVPAWINEVIAKKHGVAAKHRDFDPYLGVLREKRPHLIIKKSFRYVIESNDNIGCDFIFGVTILCLKAQNGHHYSINTQKSIENGIQRAFNERISIYNQKIEQDLIKLKYNKCKSSKRKCRNKESEKRQLMNFRSKESGFGFMRLCL